MIDVIETNEKIILVCNYKNEINLIDDILGQNFRSSNTNQVSTGKNLQSF